MRQIEFEVPELMESRFRNGYGKKQKL